MDSTEVTRLKKAPQAGIQASAITRCGLCPPSRPPVLGCASVWGKVAGDPALTEPTASERQRHSDSRQTLPRGEKEQADRD